MLTGAFIGFGNVAANGHLPGWRAREDVRIVAANDAASSRREAFLAACPGGRWYETVDDLVAGDLLMLMRNSKKIQGSSSDKQKLFERICRLDPVRALNAG